MLSLLFNGESGTGLPVTGKFIIIIKKCSMVA
jgi:hypothetical protein